MSKDPKDHPFQPGVEVAIRLVGMGVSMWETGTVAAVYKTGNFVLTGSPQQWRPSTTMGRSMDERRACAHETKDYSRRTLFLLSDVKDEMEEDRAKLKRNRRLNVIFERLRRFGSADLFTDAMLDAIEANLPPEKKDD